MSAWNVSTWLAQQSAPQESTDFPDEAAARAYASHLQTEIDAHGWPHRVIVALVPEKDETGDDTQS
jgi:hypothetical protein